MFNTIAWRHKREISGYRKQKKRRARKKKEEGDQS